MTPEELAKWIAEHCGCEASDTAAIVLLELRAAIAEEREACAKIADRAEDVKPEDNPISQELGRVVHTTGRLIATAIRGRT